MLHRHILFTTVDITQTNVKIKSNIDDWSLQRNQQRNLDTIIQTLGLRSQPINIHVIQLIRDPRSFGLGSNLPEFCNIWQMEFDIEHEDAFGENCEVALKDLNYVPLINGLTETQPAFPPVFQTTGTFKNINIISLP
jgi:hypothetical protein